MNPLNNLPGVGATAKDPARAKDPGMRSAAEAATAQDPARHDARPRPRPRVGHGRRILATPSRGGCTLVVGRVRPTTAALRRRAGLPTGAPEERGTRIPRPSPIAS